MFHDSGTPLFDLNEGQILACAKEILYACNRTHSGGDTYDSVNAMVCNENLAVLTPYDTEADPLEIKVDIIQRERSSVVVHNAWLDKKTMAKSVSDLRAAPVVTSDSEVPSKSNTKMFSPFRKLGSTKKGKKKDKRNNDPALYFGQTTPSTPVDSYDEISGVHGTPNSSVHQNEHKRTETNSSASTMATPRQPCFNRDQNDCDENTSDDELQNNNNKKSSEWHNPASSTHDFSQPLGIREGEEPAVPSAKSPNLPPPTITNAYRDKWGTSLSSFPDESSVGSSNGGQTSVSSSDNSGVFKARVKAMFSRKSKSANSAKDFEYYRESRKKSAENEQSEEDTRPSNSISMTTTATTSTGVLSSPSVIPDGVQLDLKSVINTVEEDPGVSDPVRVTPRKVINVEDISFCGTSDIDIDGRSSGNASVPLQSQRSRFINTSAQATEITDRPMCIRVEVRANSKYKICSLDPQGEGDDTWAAVSGVFQQLFYLKSFCNGRPSVSDKVVSISVVDHF